MSPVLFSFINSPLPSIATSFFWNSTPFCITSLAAAAAGFFLFRIGASFLHPNEKLPTAPCLCTVNHCCRAAKQKQYLVTAPASVNAVKPSPLMSSSLLLLMTARRLRAVFIFLRQGCNAEAAPTSSLLLHQHQLLPPLAVSLAPR
jgi:hypothetical protein